MIRFPIYIKGLCNLYGNEKDTWCDTTRSPLYRCGGRGPAGMRGVSDEVLCSPFGSSIYFDTKEARDEAIELLKKLAVAFPQLTFKGGRGKKDRDHRDVYRLREAS